MPEVACPKCSKRVKAPQEAVGKKVKCPACGQPFVVAASSEPAPAKLPTEAAPIPTQRRIAAVGPIVAALVVGLVIGSGMTWAVFGFGDRRHPPTVETSSPNSGPTAQTAGTSNDELMRKYQDALEEVRTEKAKYEKLLNEKTQAATAISAKVPAVGESAASAVERYKSALEVLRHEEATLKSAQTQNDSEVKSLLRAKFRERLPNELRGFSDVEQDDISLMKIIADTNAPKGLFPNAEKFRTTTEKLAKMKRVDAMHKQFDNEMADKNSTLFKEANVAIERLNTTKALREQEAFVARLKRECEEARAAIK